MKYILAIIIFGIIVIIHEAGHFITAKMCGIKVNKFAIGMGPALLKKQWGETEYSLRLFPVGGFCAMEGEDEESDNSRAFGKKPVWKRMIVVLAGAVMNIILGLVLLIVYISMSIGIPSMTVSNFYRNSDNSSEIAAQSYQHGLREGDKVIKIDGLKIWSELDVYYSLTLNGGHCNEVIVMRDGEKKCLKDVTFNKYDENYYGDDLSAIIDFSFSGIKKNPFTVLKYSAQSTVSRVNLVWLSLKDLIVGKNEVKDMEGPVGLVKDIGNAAASSKSVKESVMSTINLTTFITINLGVLNLLPIPGLDGGRLVFLIIEAIRRKPVKPEHEGIVHLIGMALLMILIVVVTFFDVKRLIG